MAARLAEIATRHGFTADIHPASWDPGEELLVKIATKRGLTLSTSFHRRATWGFLGHWHIGTDSDARLAVSFGNVNTSHQCKATLHGGDDFEAFATEVDRKLRQIAETDVFDAAKEAASIAREGNAVERAAKWAEYRAEEAAKRADLAAAGWSYDGATGLIYGATETLEALRGRHGEAQLVSGLGYWVRQAQQVAA